MDKAEGRRRKAKSRRQPVDWEKVPVVITGTPNPDALRLLVESIREFEMQVLVAAQKGAGASPARTWGQS